jgi:type VI secretion system protein ImpK
MTSPTETPKSSLADQCGELLAMALQLRKSTDPGTAETLRSRIDEQLRSLDVRCRQEDIPQEDVQLAKYAIVAFIDEMVLTSSWPLKDAWADKPLQLAYFNDFSAGEEFYNKVDALRGQKKNSVLEVYYLCLALGFRGKYVDLQGMEKKKTLLDTILREMKGTTSPQAQGLSPGWQPPDALPSLVRNFPAWLVAAACGLFLLFLFIVFSTLLGWQTDGVLKTLG